MAPKEVIENPPVASSSEEEEEESGSSGEESESSGEEDSKKGEDSSEEDEPAVKPTQTHVASSKKVVTEAESESESESDSDPEPAKKKSQNTAPISSASSKPTTKSSLLPESSTSKRSLKQSEDASKKKLKVSTNEEEVKKKVYSGDETKQMFQRIFSETDEINLLQGILDFTSTRAWEIDGFCDYVKELINFNANRSQLVTKIQRLKKRFANTVKNALKKGKSEEEIKFSKDLDEKIFDLSRKIWGNNGVLETKSRRKLEGKPIEFKLKPHLPKKKEEKEKPLASASASANAVRVSVVSSGSREIASFFKQDNSSAVGLDEYTIIAGWDMVPDGPKKREMEGKLKKLKAMQAAICVKRTGIVADSAKLVFKDDASSSGL